ncbi:hypothetical protein [Flavobacterium sp. KACC 22761]|uniref:hypothetical protein n=1 Tax=Flavobacterium sp. KACC 22761 TaxID=3092665 RepID=UPI002A7590A8|nr:hypothetical protein [Flavobacterium sp. KACC 22761]WPO77239.1 hypothetical protein SCB73_13295 [Flavobacterium sp. KACC 22761]
MKKILTLFAVIGLIAFTSCEGPEGPPGEPGPLAEVYEIENVNFSGTANSEVYFNFKSKLYLGDVVLVYRYDGADPVTKRDIWVPLPESHYYSDGSLYFAYKFDFTQDNVRIFTDGFGLNVNPIPADLRNAQIFRIVVVPGLDPLVTGKSVNKPDYSDYYKVIAKYNIDDSNVKKLN